MSNPGRAPTRPADDRTEPAVSSEEIAVVNERDWDYPRSANWLVPRPKWWNGSSADILRLEPPGSHHSARRSCRSTFRRI